MENLLEIVRNIADSLMRTRSSISVAESCTGGLISKSLTSISGASNWMIAGVTAYSEKSKRHILGLTDRELSEGLVSSRCAIGMVEGIARLSGSDYAVSTTGVCDGSTEGLRACTVWIGIKTPRLVRAVKIEEKDRGRLQNIEYITERALSLLLDDLRKENQ